MEICPKTRLMLVTDQIDVSPMAPSMEKSPGTRGPKGYPKERLIHALLAKKWNRLPKYPASYGDSKVSQLSGMPVVLA